MFPDIDGLIALPGFIISSTSYIPESSTPTDLHA
jgi:hypothetical protein